jgi:hypothetical protein
MDLQSLKDAAANLSLYDIKAGVRKVQNGTSTIIDALAVQKLIKYHSCHELYGNGGEGARGY